MYKILIVEDNADNLAVLEAFLEDDYDLINATDGKIGLDMAISQNPDLILMDISLPEIDGTEVLKEIRKIDNIKDTPVVASPTFDVIYCPASNILEPKDTPNPAL